MVSKLPDVVDDDDIIDVAVMDFAFADFRKSLALKFVLTALVPVVNDLDPSMGLTWEAMKPYAEGLEINVVWGMYASMVWQH